VLGRRKVLAGLQCERRLWLQVNSKSLATPPDAAAKARFALGDEVRECARELFPGGVLVLEHPSAHAKALARTQELMADAAVPAIFEAAFEFEGVRIRVDILERIGRDRWGLRQVESTGSVQPEQLDDLALQCFVLEGAGLRLVSCELIHLDTGHEHSGADIDWRRFFLRADCKAASQAALARVPERLREFQRVLGDPIAADIEPGFHCNRPHGCEFWQHCTRNKPKDWVWHLPQLEEARFLTLRDTGYERIRELPGDADLTATQRRVRSVLLSGERYLAPELSQAVANTGPPAWYLKIETASPAIPLFAGTRPYQILPFQWSLHHVGADGDVSYTAFLADGTGDPRREFCESLCMALWDDREPIHVYSPFEVIQLSTLASEFPDLARALDSLRERLFDQLELVRRHVYDVAFAGSFSLEKVAPALVPGFGWGDLEGAAHGRAAALAWPELAQGRLDLGEAIRTRHALLDYGERDTLAMAELHRVLSKG
jgi:hypothetical protein